MGIAAVRVLTASKEMQQKLQNMINLQLMLRGAWILILIVLSHLKLPKTTRSTRLTSKVLLNT